MIAVPGEKRASFAGLTSEGAGNGPGGADGLIVRAAVRVTPAYVPVIVAVVEDVTDVVVIVKLALVAPADTVTLAGVVAEGELSLSDTSAPPLGAAEVNVAVPVEELPPTTLVGFTEIADSVADGGGGGGGPAPGFTVNGADRVTPLNAPVIVTVVVAATANVLILKSANVAPNLTVRFR